MLIDYITAEWGAWGPWGSWSSCSIVCGAGQRTRTRSCYSHYPGEEGLECIGEETEDSLCDNCGGTYEYAKENHVLFSGSCRGQDCFHGVHEG